MGSRPPRAGSTEAGGADRPFRKKHLSPGADRRRAHRDHGAGRPPSEGSSVLLRSSWVEVSSPSTRRLEVSRLEGGGYGLPEILTLGAMLESSQLPGLSVPVEERLQIPAGSSLRILRDG